MARRLTAERSASPAHVSDTVLRLAVLLRAGIAPARAWSHLADSGDAAALRVRARLDEGMPLAAAIGALGGPWVDAGAAWTVATTVGAPLSASLTGIAAALRDAHESAEDVRVALAEPAGTARLMSWLPLVGVAMGLLLGFDTLGVLVSQPIATTCVGIGVALVVAARTWTTSLVRRAGAPPGVPGLDADLLAIALSGGVSIARARGILSDTGTTTTAQTDAVLDLSQRAGVPAVELLRASASLARHRARVDGRLRGAKLASRLLLPLGVCTLPAFLLLGVAPLLLSVMSTMSVPL